MTIYYMQFLSDRLPSKGCHKSYPSLDSPVSCQHIALHFLLLPASQGHIYEVPSCKLGGLFVIFAC
jgi:hypothetical protein